MLKPRIKVHLPQEAMKDRIHGTWAYARSQVYVHAMYSQKRFLTGCSTRNFSVYSGGEWTEASTACHEGFCDLLTPAVYLGLSIEQLNTGRVKVDAEDRSKPRVTGCSHARRLGLGLHMISVSDFTSSCDVGVVNESDLNSSF